MDTERGKEILKTACMNYTEFSKLVGVKPITVRLAFSGKRLSKKMVSLLEDMESNQKDEDAKEVRRCIYYPRIHTFVLLSFQMVHMASSVQSQVRLDWEVWSRLSVRMGICTLWKGIMTGRTD